ncbi:MAG: hypothetical protein OXE54_03855, partial [Gammaproteobacteria bacterium]|nr:hypothetical protein [Gammaproteobacteria bacterium]
MAAISAAAPAAHAIPPARPEEEKLIVIVHLEEYGVDGCGFSVSMAKMALGCADVKKSGFDPAPSAFSNKKVM